MGFGWFHRAAAAAAATALVLFATNPLRAADATGVRTVAEELGSRTKTQDTPADSSKEKLSDSAVRVMSTFALSILPDEIPDGSGGMTKLDKSNPNVYLIPLDDARRIIRVATRSAYAEVCNLLELEKANFNTLMRGEEARNVWSAQQLMFIKALHTFATSYFAGNVKITEQAENGAEAKGKGDAAAANATAGATTTITSKKLECSAEQREKVTQAIGVYVQSAPPAAPPTAPVAGGAN